MQEVRAIVLRAAGINTDLETEYTLELAGARADRVHINRLIEDKGLLDQYHILIFPGGFSYGDDVAAGKIMANQVVHHLAEPVRKFIDDGKLVLGICNGFQVLVKAGILPGGNGFKQEDVTITCNDSGKYEDRWVYLAPQTDQVRVHRPGAADLRAHRPRRRQGRRQGRRSPAEDCRAEGHIAFKYVDANGDGRPLPHQSERLGRFDRGPDGHHGPGPRAHAAPRAVRPPDPASPLVAPRTKISSPTASRSSATPCGTFRNICSNPAGAAGSGSCRLRRRNPAVLTASSAS